MPRAGVNTSKKKIREQMASGCGPSPLCRPCGFSKKRVPAVWNTALPGTEYPCDDPAIGAEVTLRGDLAPSRVVGCATPIGPSILQHGRVSKRRECEGALVVETPLGLRIPVTRSVVRERRRQASKPGRKTCSCAGMPYPHREGSSPLCERHPDNVVQLAELARDAYEGGDADEARFIASAARASKRGASVSTIDDAQAVLRAFETRQADDYQKAETRRLAPRREYKARLAKAKAALRAEGWDV